MPPVPVRRGGVTGATAAVTAGLTTVAAVTGLLMLLVVSRMPRPMGSNGRHVVALGLPVVLLLRVLLLLLLRVVLRG